MRKIILSAVVFALCAALCGCAADREDAVSESESAASETYPAAVSDAGTASGGAGQTEILNGYLERFGGDVCFRDAFVDFKYFILNDSELICLLAVPGAEQTTVVPFEAVTRVEQARAGEYNVVTVYDRSGGSVVIDLDDEDTALFVSKLKAA